MATTNAFIQLRTDLASQWTFNNPQMLQGEMGIESDTLRMKVGAGTTWNNTDYLAGTFDDNDFTILDNADQTKGFIFLTAGQTTGQIRTITTPDKDITLDDASDPRPVLSPYTLPDLDDLITDGNPIVISDTVPNTQGFLGDVVGGGVALVYSTTGLYDPLNGGIFCGAGGISIKGSAVRIDSLARGSVSEVFADSAGHLFAQDPPVPGWQESDTDGGSYDLGAGTGVGTSIPITGLTVTVPTGGEIDPGEQLSVYVTLHAVEKSGTRTGDMEVGFGLNGAPPTSWTPKQISGGFNGIVTVALVSTNVTLVATDTIEVWARINNGTNGAYGVDVTGGTHELIAEKAGESGVPASGEANTTSNDGGGVSLAKVKSGINLPFRTLNATEFELSGDIAQLRAAGIAISKLAVDPRARTTHTGTQLLATISDAGTLAGKSALTLITEIDAALRSGLDLILITGTAGTDGNLAVWNADGDVVDGGAPPAVPVDTTEFNAGSISGTVAFDSANGVNQRAVLTGDLTLDPITNTSPGDSGNLILDNTGAHIFSVGAWKVPVTIDSSKNYISLSWANQNGDLVMYGGSYT